MTELRIELYKIPAADLGPENPLPVFRAETDDVEVSAHGSVPEEDRQYLGCGIGYRVLPYRMLDSFNRKRHMRAFRAVLMENEFLRVTVLPEIDGRIASIIHKPTNRELLDRNPVFQPANLALRGAWVSGGVEWNTCQYGHYYLTCSPVFAARVDGLYGEPALRIYEWDRVKCFPWQVDLVLPPGSPFLFARVRIINPHEYEMPMYWWTNIAVPEIIGHRTLAPAETAIYNHQNGLHVSRVPEITECDASYATNHPYAREMFFRIPGDQRKWIAVLDENGEGIVHASTSKLRGRKMFVWGMNRGGRRWQEYLSEPGRAYIEIQAGLARTQLESVPMPAKMHWTWTEAFGLLQADPAKVHSSDWSEAWRSAESALNDVLPQEHLDNLHEELDKVTKRIPTEIIAVGSGWGALERLRIAVQGQEDRIPHELVFDKSTISVDQLPWLNLLENGYLPERDTSQDPGQYMIQPEWRELLERSILSGKGDHWLSWLHLGVMHMEARDADRARAAWEESLSRNRNGWALRNLAILENRAGNTEAWLNLLSEAWEVGPRIPHLAVECCNALASSERYEEMLHFVESLPKEIRNNERIRILEAKASIEVGNLDALDGFFDQEFATIREGEVTLTDLWFLLHERKLAAKEGLSVNEELRARVHREFPPPRHIDFRISDTSDD
jgi:tetratricopeptide (TPR) repeat protein